MVLADELVLRIGGDILELIRDTLKGRPISGVDLGRKSVCSDATLL